MSGRSLGSRLFPDPATWLSRYITLMQAAREQGHRIVAILVSRHIARRFGCYISWKARIARGVRIPHPTGLVIGDGVVIEEDVTLYQHVTLGARRLGDSRRGEYPVIRQGAVIFAGAVVVGPIEIGQGAVIGANSVVLHSVPPGSTAAGAPARVR
jgi:serine O-acetyltransferase